MNKIKVLEIVPNMQQGGLENLIMNIFRNIDREKYEIHFLYHYTGDYYFDKEIIKLGGVIHKCSFREDNNIFKYVKYLKKLFKENNFDVIHSHMLSTSYFTLSVAKKANVKIRINHAHNTTTEKSIKGFLKGIMIKIASKNANKLLACSVEAGKFAYKSNKFEVIDNCINVDKFIFSEINRNNIRKKLNIKNDDILFGNIGRLNVQKNQMFLIDVFSKISSKNIKLLIIGFGELKSEILKKIKECELEDRVIMLENVKTEFYYSAIDCFLLPSKFEGFPLTAVEAQANGCPCIFSNTLTSDVKINDNVEFVDINNIDSWVSELNKLSLKRERNISEKIYKYDIRNLINKIEKIYEGK